MFAGDSGLRIGTSSWSSRDWVGPFYPPGTAPNQFISHYATVYDTVEIDATFYAPPNETQVRAWRDRTPEGFVFAAKVPRIITHQKRLQGAEADVHSFLEAMAELGDRLGPLLFQFPYFNRQAFPGPGPFFERLDEFLGKLPAGFRYAVELRNRHWVGRDLQNLCARHEVALVWSQQAWMPLAREWMQRTGGPSAPFAYIRWLGDHKAIEEITKTWEKTVVDRRAEMQSWVPVVRGLRAAGADVFGFFNNHYSGHAPSAVELFRELWQEE